MGRSHTTLSRARRRNTGQRGSRYQQAHQMASQRHTEKPKAVKLTELVRTDIHANLCARWSPAQRGGRLKLEEDTSLSPETGYRLGLNAQPQGGHRYRY